MSQGYESVGEGKSYLEDRVAEVKSLYEHPELRYRLLYDRQGRLPFIHHQIPGTGESTVQPTQTRCQDLTVGRTDIIFTHPPTHQPHSIRWAGSV